MLNTICVHIETKGKDQIGCMYFETCSSLVAIALCASQTARCRDASFIVWLDTVNIEPM